MNTSIARRTTYSFADLKDSVFSIRFATLAIVALWIVLWHARAAQQFSLEAAAYGIAFVVVCAAYGALFERATSGLVPNRVGVAFRLVTGFFTFNSLLFILTIATPLGIVICVAVLAILPFVIIGLLNYRGHSHLPVQDEWPGLICATLAGLVATLWAAEHQPVMEIRHGAAVFRSWFDIFIHAREISAFVQGHGLSSMSDIKMLGSPAPAYHFASYVGPAAFSALTSSSAMVNFGGFMLPFGILLLALAAFILVGNVLGTWPGLMASIALVTLPDAYQQGFGEGYLGFQFMSQVNLGMLYGIACMSLAWIFMIEGCHRSRYATVVVAYCFLALTLMYKAHVFVAAAYVLLIFPCLYFAGLRRRWRVASLLGMTVIFVAVIQVSQLSPNVPTLRLDGSGGGEYMSILYLGFDNGPLKHALRWLLFDHRLGRVADATTATVLILFGSFGVWIVAAPAIFWASRRRLPALIPGLVALVFVNYWVMSIGLAVDARRIGGPEELLNRPMAWAYFVIVAFACGALYRLAIGDGAPRGGRARVVLAIIVAASLANVFFEAHNAQTFKAVAAYRDFADFNAIPLCEYRADEYLRLNSGIHDVVQDSTNDPRFITTALSERQAYVVESFFAGMAPKQKARLRELDLIALQGDVPAFEDLARRNGIDWYLLHPEEALRWPAQFRDSAVFVCDGYRVIHLNTKASR